MLTMTEGPFAFVVRRYEEHLEQDGKELKVNKHRLGRLKKEWGSKGTLTPTDVETFLVKLKDNKPASRNRYKAIIRALLNWAMAMELVSGSFNMYSLKGEKVRDSRERRLEPGEEEKLLQAMRFNDDLKDAFLAAIDTGLRKKALFRVTFEMVRNGVLEVPGYLQKTKIAQKIPLTDRVKKIILKRSYGVVSQDTIFGMKDWEGKWERARRNASVEGLHWHDLRREFASRLVDKGVGLEVVSKLLGHTSLQQTGRYIKVREDSIQDAIERLN